MSPYALIVDEFLDDFAAFRKFALSHDFDAVQGNPTDGYAYPHTVMLLDDHYGVERKLALIVGAQITLRLLVLRLSPEGTIAPEQAHSDLYILIPPSQYSAILYVNAQTECREGAGTSFLRHRASHDQTGESPDHWKNDQNDADKWETVVRIPMEENRVVVFPSCLIHRSEPVGGFGADKTNARLVLVAMFDIA